MIDYIEVLDSSRELVGIIDTAKSIIWHDVFFGCGDFEIYVSAEPYIVELLQNPYIKRTDSAEIGVVERIEIAYNQQDGLMLTASGRFAKSILDRRLICKFSGHSNAPTFLSGKVEQAIRTVVSNNAISATNSMRNISIIELGEYKNYPEIILSSSGQPAQKQVSYQNLLEYTDKVLEEYEMSAKLLLDEETKKLKYEVFKGTYRSIDSETPVIFSQDYDNLAESNYQYDETLYRNVALIGGSGEGADRYYALLDNGSTGLDRRELFIDASQSEDSEESTDYEQNLITKGMQELAQLQQTESFSGTINLEFSPFKLNDDFSLGDIVTIQDNKINKYMDVRITEVTEIQDENGYNVEIVYG